MPRVSLQFVMVVFPDHTHLLFLIVLLELSVADIMQLNPVSSNASHYCSCVETHIHTLCVSSEAGRLKNNL